MMNQKVLRQASVCTGLGAAELAAKSLGWENVFMSEIDNFCRHILSYHFPNTKLYGDFTKEDFRQYRGLIDVFTAGFPCQPFSVSGDRKGAEDHRYLWPKVHRLIDEFQPAWFIGENVAGITSMVFPGNETKVESQSSLFEEGNKETILEENFILESICQDLESIGYSVQPFIIPACAIGAPHRRDRIWIVANSCCESSDISIQQWGQNTSKNINIARKDEGRTSSDSNCFRSERRATKSNRIKKNEEIRTNIQFKTNGSGLQQASSDSQCERGRQIFKEIQSGQPNGNGINSVSNERITSDSSKLNGNIPGFHTSKISQFETSGIWTNNWRNFPTQSPICSRNDGFSDLLDSNSLLNGKKPRQPWQAYGKWRTESIKGFGNAIVPQVLYQFFEIINKIENNDF